MVNKETTDSSICGDKGKTWKQSLRNELGLLSQDKKNVVNGTDTIDFIPRSDIKQGRDIMYANFVCNYRPLKYEPY